MEPNAENCEQVKDSKRKQLWRLFTQDEQPAKQIAHKPPSLLMRGWAFLDPAVSNILIGLCSCRGSIRLHCCALFACFCAFDDCFKRHILLDATRLLANVLS